MSASRTTLYSARPAREHGCRAVVADRLSYADTTLWRQCRSPVADGGGMCPTHRAKMDAGLKVMLYRPVEGGVAEDDLRSHLAPEALVRASVLRSKAVQARLRAERRDAACTAARACERRNGARGMLRTLTTAAAAGTATGWLWGSGGGGGDQGASAFS